METRWTRREMLVGALVIVTLLITGVTTANPPWKKLVPFRSVEADPNKTYWLSENHGPWMIMATSFAGPGAEEQAQSLVLELRQRYKLDAFMHKRTFDYTQPVVGRGLNRYGGPKRMRHQTASKFDEIAVLVGNYTSFEAPDAQSHLEVVKTAKPNCLDISSPQGKTTTQRFIGLRELQRLVHADPEMQQLGPMRRAFIARNPLLPREYFVAGGVDPFVLDMNKQVEHGLLNNPGQYTVRVASFQGESHFEGEDQSSTSGKLGLVPNLKPRSNPGNKLEVAADNAHRLTEALRKRGVEAYEFHDRFESIVTIGSFPSVGTQLPDGRLDLHPEVYQIMQTYGAKRSQLPQHAQGLQPRSLDGIPFDVQPMPVKVPRSPLGTDYVAGG